MLIYFILFFVVAGSGCRRKDVDFLERHFTNKETEKLDINAAYNYYVRERIETDSHYLSCRDFKMCLYAYKYVLYVLCQICGKYNHRKEVKGKIKLSNLSYCIISFYPIDRNESVDSQFRSLKCPIFYSLIKFMFFSNSYCQYFFGRNSRLFNFEFEGRRILSNHNYSFCINDIKLSKRDDIFNGSIDKMFKNDICPSIILKRRLVYKGKARNLG